MSRIHLKRDDSPLPFYVQIKDILKRRILDGTYKPHEKLASELDLMTMFGVSRITIRQALRDLRDEGLVFSSKGKGTYVSRPKATQSLRSLKGFEESMSREGYVTSSRVVGVKRRRPHPDIKAALQLGPREDVLEIKRVRFLDQAPVSVDICSFPMAIGRRLMEHNLERDLFPMLENELGMTLRGAEVKIAATSADTDTQKLLEIAATDPILKVERVTYDAENRPVDFEHLLIRGDAYQYQFWIARESGAFK